jgi:hypothetical protein
MRTKDFLIASIFLFCTSQAFAWGQEGHRLIGQAAFELLDDEAREQVLELLGNPSPDALADELSSACNWPDRVRDQAGWKWTSPLHYVNIPRHASEYDRERDCPDGRCVTEGVLDFANQLSYEQLEPEKRWQAFAFVCHLVADLHQPLHAGFRDDRGGNTVDIEYQGREWNLHQFWDGVVVRERLQDEEQMLGRLVEAGRARASRDFDVSKPKSWTEESHALAVSHAYPDSHVIDAAFADRSWKTTLECWERAAGRLAQVLNAVLGNNEVRL